MRPWKGCDTCYFSIWNYASWFDNTLQECKWNYPLRWCAVILCLKAWNHCFTLHVSSYCYQTMCILIFHIHGKPRHSPHDNKKKYRLHWQFKAIIVHTRDWFLKGIFISVTYLKWQPLTVKINILKIIMTGTNGMTGSWYTIVEMSSTRYSLFMSKVQAGTSLLKASKLIWTLTPTYP